jgi:hypothetical protein
VIIAMCEPCITPAPTLSAEINVVTENGIITQAVESSASTIHILDDMGKEMQAIFTIDVVSEQIMAHQAMPCFGHVYEHSHLRMPSGFRPLLYESISMVSMHATFSCLPYAMQALFRRMVGLSQVSVCSPRSQSPSMEETVMLTFMEFDPTQDIILMDGYFSTRNHIVERSTLYIQSRSIPKPNPYNPALHKFPVLLDLDKTLIITYEDTRLDQRHIFEESMTISGTIAITGTLFQHRVMIRNGAHAFIKAILPFADISVITAGDIHYGRAIVDVANKQKWLPIPSEEADHVSISLTRVFSVRDKQRSAQKKQLSCALPCFHSIPGSFVAVDDDPTAWDQTVHDNVIPVPPFEPSHNSADTLMRIVPVIQAKMQAYYEPTPDEVKYD